MILTCPECSTKYVVKDGAIPEGGRKVRCASCKHSWHQDPDVLDDEAPEAVEPATTPADVPTPQIDETIPFAGAGDVVLDEQAAGPIETVEEAPVIRVETTGDRDKEHEHDPRWTPVDTGAAWREEPAPVVAPADEFEPFYPADDEDDATRRKWPLVVGVILIIAAVVVAFWYLAPSSMKQRVGLAQGGSPLEVMAINNDRQPLASGNDLFTVSGRIINPTGTSQPVPPLRAELLDESKQKVIHSWMISPPVDTLSPNESRVFHSAEVDVPEGGKFIRVRLATSG